jgi:putative heme-binding domain-containing protein
MNVRGLVVNFWALLIVNVAGQTPEWIWHPDTNASTVFFRKNFRTPPLIWNSRLTISADDEAEVLLNGVPVARCSDWQRPARGEVTVRLNQGQNVIAVRASNRSGAVGLLVHLNLGGETNVVTDSSWVASTNEEPNWSGLNFNAAHWSSAKTLGAHGTPPWGDVLFRAAATPAESLRVALGFEVELLRSAEPGEGSWICMTFDDRGRIIISPQGTERPLLRMKAGAGGGIEQVEILAAPVRYAMGLLQAFDSLYINGIGPQGSGLYRLIDTNKNDQYETNEVHFLKKFEGGSEHGYHALALGPDRKIYVLNGNGTKLPEGMAARSPYRHYGEDALSGSPDMSKDIDGSKAPACHVLRTDPEGRNWEVWAGGMRNAYDFDFNQEGELFTFDSDMEWDWGTPWYRPTRIQHLVSGGEYGWRDGTRMWSDGFPDAFRPVLDIGIGSPTGVKFGSRSRFPLKYQRALYVMDWSYGRILAVHLTPTGATYKGSWESFVEGKPLNVASLAFGPDGAMYFITGGRGTQSGLYRVRYTGSEATSTLASKASTNENRALRRKLESLHLQSEKREIDFIWNELDHSDPAVRFAARVALEALPVEIWRKQALAEVRPGRAMQSLLALARTDSRERQNDLLKALERFPLGELDAGNQIAKLRILEISIARDGDPESGPRSAMLSELERYYPASSPTLNRELSRILIRMGGAGVVGKTVRLLQTAATQEEQMHYIEQLRNVRLGWTLPDRKRYLGWFNKPRERRAHPPELLQQFKDVGREYVDGAWFDRYLRDFKREAVATLTVEERQALEPLLSTPIVQGRSIPQTREFVRQWKMEDLLPELEKQRATNLARGRQAYVDAQCQSCHRFANDGGIIGPELTGAGSKYSARDVLESIIEPSKIVSDQYQNHTAILKDGDSFTGRLVSESQDEIVLETDRLSGTKETIARIRIEQFRPSQLSPMPEGLVDVLSKEEILDLVAYLRSGTN